MRTASGADAPTAAQRTAAATATAHGNRACAGVKPFYWEIGDRHAALGSGTEGAPLPRRPRDAGDRLQRGRSMVETPGAVSATSMDGAGIL